MFKALPVHAPPPFFFNPQRPWRSACTFNWLHLIYSCLTTARLFPRRTKHAQARGMLDKGAAEVVWFHHNHFISPSRNPSGPASIQTCLCSHGSKGTLPLQNLTRLSETFQATVAYLCTMWNASYLLHCPKANIESFQASGRSLWSSDRIC